MSYGQNPFGDQYSPQPGPNPYQPSNYGNLGPPQGQFYPPGTVKNYLVESILALIFCGHLLAIPALIFASQVNGKLAQGDYNGAVQASNNAKLWLTIAVSIAVVCNLGGCCLGMLIVAAGEGR